MIKFLAGVGVGFVVGVGSTFGAAILYDELERQQDKARQRARAAERYGR